MTAGSHLSIGEVLSLVQSEFPDVTISKIRFLESQGLLDPERTPSGYRKFYESDVERLEWILTQQRDNFLPLKVIRERLHEWDETGRVPEITADDRGEPPAANGDGSGAVGTDVPGAPPADPRRAATSLAAGSAMEVMSSNRGSAPTSSAAAPSTTSAPASEADPESARWARTSGLTAEELADKAGIPVSVVNDLQSFSMIKARRVGTDDYFDDDALEVAIACKGFVEAGIEVRHLRMYKIAAEREAGMLEQLVMPLVKQRNPDAKMQALKTVNNLADAGIRLHAALLQAALDDALG